MRGRKVWLLGLLLLLLSACQGAAYLTSTPRSAGSGDDITGHYAVSGTDLAGKTYNGELTITRQGDVYAVVWTLGETQIEGTGLLDGDVLAVTWDAGGVPGLVVYRIVQPGILEGRWTVQGETTIATERARRVP